MPCLRMSVNRLREGMMIKEDVFSKTGAVIVPDGAVVTKDVVALLTRHFVDSVMVEYPTGRKERPEQQEQSAPAKEQHLKEFQAEFSVAEQSISEELKDIVYRSKDVNISMLLEPLNGLLKKADDDTDLADMLLHMKKQQSGLYAHTINVALFGQLLARWSGCTEAEMEEVMAAGLLHDMMNGIAFVTQPKNIARMKKDLPILFVSGDCDPVGEQGRGVIRAYKCFLKAGMKDVTMKLYHGGRHEMLNETNRAEVYEDVLSWLNSKTGK